MTAVGFIVVRRLIMRAGFSENRYPLPDERRRLENKAG
jgi:hypothetical protein